MRWTSCISFAHPAKSVILSRVVLVPYPLGVAIICNARDLSGEKNPTSKKHFIKTASSCATTYVQYYPG